MTDRTVIILDTETDGLDQELNRAVEVGYLSWPNGDTGPRGLFVPPHTLDYADPQALRINGYHHRIAHRRRDYGYRQTAELHAALAGNSLGGANPAFDADMLEHLFREANLRPFRPWHHRLVDVEAYAGAVLGFDPRNLPGLSTLCETVGVTPGDHGAWPDAVAAWNVLSVVVDASAAVGALVAP